MYVILLHEWCYHCLHWSFHCIFISIVKLGIRTSTGLLYNIIICSFAHRCLMQAQHVDLVQYETDSVQATCEYGVRSQVVRFLGPLMHMISVRSWLLNECLGHFWFSSSYVGFMEDDQLHMGYWPIVMWVYLQQLIAHISSVDARTGSCGCWRCCVFISSCVFFFHLQAWHWRQIFQGTSRDYDPLRQYKVEDMINLHLTVYSQLIDGILLSAIEAYGVEHRFNKIRSFWMEQEFKLEKHVLDSAQKSGQNVMLLWTHYFCYTVCLYCMSCVVITTCAFVCWCIISRALINYYPISSMS